MTTIQLQLLRPLGAVERTGLRPPFHAGSIQSTAEDVVTYTREILDTTATHEHDGVLLEVVTLTRDVGIDLFRIRETYTRDLTHSGVRLLGSRGIDSQAYATLLRASIQRTRFRLHFDNLASFANQLLNCWHKLLLVNKL